MLCGRCEARTYYELKKKRYMDGSSISKMLDMLESREYIRRENSEKKKIISFTDKANIVFETLNNLNKMEEGG